LSEVEAVLLKVNAGFGTLTATVLLDDWLRGELSGAVALMLAVLTSELLL
jgi:hypothetical protein